MIVLSFLNISFLLLFIIENFQLNDRVVNSVVLMLSILYRHTHWIWMRKEFSSFGYYPLKLKYKNQTLLTREVFYLVTIEVGI